MFVAASISSYVAPYVVKRIQGADPGPLLTEADERVNDQTVIGLTALTTTFLFVVVGMATGKTAAAAADPGGKP
jgi:hypothetical protein